MRSTIPLRVGPCPVTSHAGRTHIITPSRGPVPSIGIHRSRPAEVNSPTEVYLFCHYYNGFESKGCVPDLYISLLPCTPFSFPQHLAFYQAYPRFILKHAIFPGKKLYPEVQSSPTAPSTKMSSLITQHSSIHSKAVDNHDTSLKYAQKRLVSTTQIRPRSICKHCVGR